MAMMMPFREAEVAEINGRGDAAHIHMGEETPGLCMDGRAAQKYASLPPHLQFMFGTLTKEQTSSQKEISIANRKLKADLQFVPDLLSATSMKPLEDHELLKLKTIKNPVADKKKRANWKAIQLSNKDKDKSPKAVEPHKLPVKSQSSPALIRTARTEEFFTLREHQNELAEMARQHIFHTTIDVENEPVLPWKSVFRKPRKVKKPISPYRLDAVGGKGNQDRNVTKFFSERSSKKDSSKFDQPMNELLIERGTKELKFRPKLGMESYRVLNPSNSSPQLVHSNFFQLPEDHVANQHLHESPPPSRQNTARLTISKRQMHTVDVKVLKHLRPGGALTDDIGKDDNDDDTEITDSLSVRDNIAGDNKRPDKVPEKRKGNIKPEALTTSASTIPHDVST
jgi:hypothetical protein